jgi:uncharacterized repeat protein (TIGR01451 family)
MTSATFNGTALNCDISEYTYQFFYGTNPKVLDQMAPATPALGSGTDSTSVTGLTPNTTYYYEYVVNGTPDGVVSFTTGRPPSPTPPPPEDPHADLAVSVTADKANPHVGETLTYAVEVKNWGPREATNVTLKDVLPAQVTFVSAAGSAPPTARRLQDSVPCSGGSTVTCHIGVLGFGSVSTTSIVTKVTAAGDAINTASVSNPDQPDPTPGNSTTTTTVPVAPPPPAAAPPVYGQSFDVRPVSGTVLVRLPGTSTFVPLTDVANVPNGTEIDVTKGRVEITSASDPANDQQTAQFYDGRFILVYASPDIGTVPLPPGTPATLYTSLVLSTPLDCRTKSKRQRAQTPLKKVRSLWGTGKGNFRTRGKYAAASVRGTIWFTQDTCTTTTVRVQEGLLDVYDFVLNRHFLVGPGQSHTARKKP